MLVCGSGRTPGREELGRTVYRLGAEQPLLAFGIDRPTAAWPQFSMDETLLAWAHTDGSVQIADLPAVQRWLAQFGLGW